MYTLYRTADLFKQSGRPYDFWVPKTQISNAPHHLNTFLTSRDFIISPLIEGGLLGLTLWGTHRIAQLVPSLDWIALFIMGYLLLVILTLLTLKLLRMFFPLREGIYSVASNPWQVYVWNLHGFLTMMNLYWVHGNCLLPYPLRGIVLRAMGMKIGPGSIVGGAIISDPHLTTVGSHVVLGFNCAISSHAIIRTGAGLNLILGKVDIASHALIGGTAQISPGVSVGAGAIINEMSVVPMNTKIEANEIWSGIPAKKVRNLV